eukprot:GHVQ01029670.1.p1 GENE.GHVQ01029670.1~~GHVQ01029670.1.p1  ORF type:complete len:596 (-),score=139.08 GHVQ01029670.1:744-2531(-)
MPFFLPLALLMLTLWFFYADESTSNPLFRPVHLLYYPVSSSKCQDSRVCLIQNSTKQHIPKQHQIQQQQQQQQHQHCQQEQEEPERLEKRKLIKEQNVEAIGEAYRGGIRSSIKAARNIKQHSCQTYMYAQRWAVPRALLLCCSVRQLSFLSSSQQLCSSLCLLSDVECVSPYVPKHLMQKTRTRRGVPVSRLFYKGGGGGKIETVGGRGACGAEGPVLLGGGMKGYAKIGGRVSDNQPSLCRILDWSNKLVDYETAWVLQQLLVEKKIRYIDKRMRQQQLRRQQRHDQLKQQVPGNEGEQLQWGIEYGSEEENDEEEQVEGGEDYAVMLQHEPVYTLGTGATVDNILSNNFNVIAHDKLHQRLRHLLTSLQHNPATTATTTISSSCLDGIIASISSPSSPTSSSSSPCHSPPEKASNSFPLCYRVDRGGEVTYHCPGQLVLYPIIDLRRHGKDLHQYLRMLEEVVIITLRRGGLDISGERVKGLTGVWVNGRKICAEGVKVKRWVTSHGLALNVRIDLSGFEKIVPCGLQGRGVMSVHELVPNVRLRDVGDLLMDSFCEVFGYRGEKVRSSRDLVMGGGRREGKTEEEVSVVHR